MNNVCILLTSKYPYEQGEEFIETEIDYLCSTFKEVIIVSGGKGRITRRVPENCNIHSFKAAVSEIGRYEKLKSMQHPEFYYVISKSMKNKSPKDFYHTAMTEMRNISRIERHVEFISNLIGRNGYADSQITVYSYWMSFNILVVYHLKTIYPFIKTVVRAHNTDLYEFVDRFESRYPLINLFRKIDSLNFISEHGKKYFEKKYGKYIQKNSFLSRLGVQPSEIAVDHDRKGSLRIITVSSLTEIKRVDRVIESLSLLKIPVRWVHIGSGPLEENLKKLAEEYLHGSSNVEYEFKGYMKNSEVKAFYKEFRPHLFLNTSLREGVPVSIMEAMSMGVPVIALNSGGCSEIVDEKNGILLPEKSSPRDVANAIQEIRSKGQLEYSNMSKSAFDMWYCKFNSEKNYKKFADSISRLSKD